MCKTWCEVVIQTGVEHTHTHTGCNQKCTYEHRQRTASEERLTEQDDKQNDEEFD